MLALEIFLIIVLDYRSVNRNYLTRFKIQELIIIVSGEEIQTVASD